MSRLVWILAGVALCIAVVAFIVVPKLRKIDFWVVNGLDVPVDVTVRGETFTVEPHGTASIRTRQTPFTAVVTAPDGTEIDRQEIAPRGGGLPVAFNVLGAAPLHVGKKLYSFQAFTIDGPRPGEDLLGVRTVEREDIHYFLVDWPERIAKPEDAPPGPVERRRLEVAGTWKDTFARLAEKRRTAEAQALLAAVAVAQPGAEAPVELPAAAPAAPVAAAPPPAAEPEPPSVGPDARTGHDWKVQSSDKHALLVHRAGDDGCEARCLAEGAIRWTSATCMGKDTDEVFVTGDCARTVVVRRYLPAGDLEDLSVATVYEHGVAGERIPASRFVADAAGLLQGDDGRAWMFGTPRSDGTTIEVETLDHRKHQIALVTAAVGAQPRSLPKQSR